MHTWATTPLTQPSKVMFSTVVHLLEEQTGLGSQMPYFSKEPRYSRNGKCSAPPPRLHIHQQNHGGTVFSRSTERVLQSKSYKIVLQMAGCAAFG
ncbi:hypothetical protein IAQ61_001197 [Plenodomus lingam]|uniref:uncharacterized protein n=1 Tax=Leptosphaeria maculans TaxID=5022 RepID=UPI00332B16BC|nr:hypothetical protein IAQ61_001197 [Plenodomus lingam]